MSRGKQIIGILIIVVSIGSLVVWEKWGKTVVINEEILVLRENVPKATVITEEMLGKKNVADCQPDALRACDLKAIVGKVTTGNVHKNVQLFREYFDNEDLIADFQTDTYRLTVPSRWLESWPEELYAGEKVYFFADGKVLTSAGVKSVEKEKESFDIIVNSKEAEVISRAVSKEIKLVVGYN